MKYAIIVSFLVLVSALSAYSYAQQPAARTLPGGATSLNETFQDWIVGCQATENATNCVLSQDQTQGDGQRLLLINIQPDASGTADGRLILPFGLLLQHGVHMRIDEAAWIDEPLRFVTCQPVGCIIDFQLDPATVQAIRRGLTLILAGTVSGEQQFEFRIPLNGFAAASDRALSLMAQ